MNLIKLEREGIGEALELKIKLLNRLRESHALQTDPATRFKLEQEIKSAEAEIRESKSKLGALYNIHTSEGETELKKIIRGLEITEPVGVADLVNCDRSKEKDRFWDEFDHKNKSQHKHHFYFIGACERQMPPSFAEYMVYELIEEELNGISDTLYRHARDKSQRIKIHELPSGRNLERCKNDFKTFFVNFISTGDANAHNPARPEVKATDFDVMLQSGIIGLDYDYATVIFEINSDEDWKEYFPEYFEWIMDTFSAFKKGARFLFFFVLYSENLHDLPGSGGKRAIDSIEALAGKRPEATFIKPLKPVSDKDLRNWFKKLGEKNPSHIDPVIDIAVMGLKQTEQDIFMEKKLLNMCDVEVIQKIACEVAMENKQSANQNQSS